MVAAATTLARGFRRHRRALGSNPLIRLSDRLEALTVLAVFVMTVLAIPLAAQAGALVYHSGVQVAEAQAHSRHSVAAVALDGASTMPTDFDGPAEIRAQWREGTQLRTAQVIPPGTVKAGEPLTIWLSDTGKVVAAPLTAQDAKLSAVAAGWTVWVAIVACTASVAFVVRRQLDRSRARAWERELNLLAHNDDGWANRYT